MNQKLSNNKITRNKYPLFFIPFLTIKNYFQNLENLYFLFLSLIQLSTIWNTFWSPTGPYSTFIPLLLCVLMEIIINTYTWINNYILDYKENNKKFKIHPDLYMLNQDLHPGIILILNKDDICPIDGILTDCIHAKISKALINGESTYHYIFKDSLILSGSIIKSDQVSILITACGKDKQNTIGKFLDKRFSTIDKFIGNYMIKRNGILLLLMIIFMSSSPISLIQNWILFNGIIPFSIKIFLILSRAIQSWLIKTIKVNNSKYIDDLDKITTIISDKTGTLTKNQLELLEIYMFNDYSHSLNCIKYCIHKEEDLEFDTPEDKAIFYLDKNSVGYLHYQKSNLGNDILDLNKLNLQIIERPGLKFTHQRKTSSVIIKNNDKYYLYCKGSLNKFRQILKDHSQLDQIDEFLIKNKPEMRLLAFGYRELDPTEIYNEDLEHDLIFLGIFCFKDNLQENVKETIHSLNLNFGILTGDRKETAIAIGKEIGILNDDTIVFSGSDINRDKIKKTRNFIGYEMTPSDKRQVAQIFDDALAIGDGFNDIGMFQASQISVAIAGQSFVENNADYVVTCFQDLEQAFSLNKKSFNKNILLTKFVFLRCVFINFCSLLYLLLTNKVLFDGWTLQAFNFLWTIFPIIYLVMKDVFVSENGNLHFETDKWNFGGIALAFCLISSCYNLPHDQIVLAIIFILNAILFWYLEKDKISFLCSIAGIIFYWIKMIFIPA